MAALDGREIVAKRGLVSSRSNRKVTGDSHGIVAISKLVVGYTFTEQRYGPDFAPEMVVIQSLF